jgi:hypothetical protein
LISFKRNRGRSLPIFRALKKDKNTKIQRLARGIDERRTLHPFSQKRGFWITLKIKERRSPDISKPIHTFSYCDGTRISASKISRKIVHVIQESKNNEIEELNSSAMMSRSFLNAYMCKFMNE